jgi:hypothetical protein
MNIGRFYRKTALTIAPQSVANGMGICVPKMSAISPTWNAHTIAASRRLAPLKKNIFGELECRIKSLLRLFKVPAQIVTPALPLPKIQPNQTKSNQEPESPPICWTVRWKVSQALTTI